MMFENFELKYLFGVMKYQFVDTVSLSDCVFYLLCSTIQQVDAINVIKPRGFSSLFPTYLLATAPFGCQ